MICDECGKELTNEADCYGHDCEVVEPKEKQELPYVVIEQDGEGGAYITHINNPEDYQSIGDGVMICLKEQDYYNMCQAGVGA